MKKLIITLSLVVIAVCFISLNNTNETTKFLNTLDEKQLDQVLIPFDDTSREKWHYLPAASWPRKGLKIGDLNKSQKIAFSNMLKSFLSKSGYKKTQDVIELENVLVELGGNPSYRDTGAYYLCIYGHPKTDSLWSWSFEGHHLSLNFTVANGTLATAPRFFGANPGNIPSGSRKGERILDKEEDLAFELLNTLTEDQKKEAIFNNVAFPDVLTRNASKVNPLEPFGIEVRNLNSNQKTLLKELLKEYLSSIPRDVAIAREKKINNEEFEYIKFAWAGAQVKGIGHYYRIQGKSFLIEFDNTQNGANHIHTVWRDFDGDFGRDLIRDHYHNAEHHHKK
ncbi:DUF3500 domain-containing protein [Hyunsoonleella flava]|uniref:DUF3500 domain-containing protein n=1 Tax=Hyunsoonleella flava TaxID=2527939 RepID=A0A4Q9FI09_9FLAO|nr:DUF3500 domain-containing protein [Hyunsoonleella flava]TBN06738.1 DUF3500 domain-containing protein [Hyunsoonleella flava]